MAKQGYRGILSTGFYLDQPQYTAYHYRNEIVPQGLNGVDTISDNDSAQSWSFSIPRLKGARLRSFTLVKGEAAGAVLLISKANLVVRCRILNGATTIG